MLIRRIQVRNFRKLTDLVEVSDLGPGLTVIAGDNEAGKSTLLDAVRTALFERHNVGGRVLDDMMPYGSSVRPEIALDFEIDGEGYALRKKFGRSASAELSTPSGRFEGPAADEKLAQLLQFELVDGRTGDERRREARGMIGLFWLEQGQVHHGLGVGGRGQQTLRGALEDEVGDVLGGSRGQRLRAAAGRERTRLLTRTGKPTGRLVEVQRAAAKAQDELAEIEDRLRDYEAEIDLLGRKKAQLAALEAERTIDTLRKRYAAVKERADALAAIEAEVAAHARDEELERARWQAATDRVRRRETLVAETEEAGRRAVELDEERSEAARQASAWQKREKAARKKVAAAHERLSRARANRRAAEAALRAGALRERSAEFTRLLKQVAQFQASRATAQAERAAIKVDADGLKRLRDLDAALREARTRRDAAATRVTPKPMAGQVARLNGNELAPDEPVELAGPSEFELTGWGRFLVSPGAGDLGRLVAEVERREAALARALDEVECASLAEAEAAVARDSELAAQLREAEQGLKAVAPKGVEALEGEAARIRAELDRLGEAAPVEASAEEGSASIDLEALSNAEAEAESTVAEIEAEYDRVREEAQRQSDRLIRIESQADSARTAHDGKVGELAKAREEVSDAALAEALEERRSALEVAARALAESQARHGAADPELVRLELERAEQALGEATQERDRLEREIRELGIRLEEKGGSGLGEAAERARAALERMEAECRQLEAEAAALDLLDKVLADAEARAREAFLEPILSRVAPFLRLVIPDAQLRLHDSLEIAGVERGGRVEPYTQLSVGTREQLSVLVRLAFAVYLREKGFPAMVILDDTLVFSDSDRFDRMQLALRRAAQTVQILVLTCRAQDWRSAGAPVRDLQALSKAVGA